MKISEFRSLLTTAATRYQTTSVEYTALTKVIDALTKHDAATVDALVTKLGSVSIKPPAPPRTPKPRTAGGTPRKTKPKPTKEQIGRAKENARAKLKEAYLDDDLFRTTLAQVAADDHITPAAARELFGMFFEAELLPEKANKKATFKQLATERQTDVLQKKRLGEG